MGSLSYGELAGERMQLGLLLHDPEEEHDCFSDNTHASHYYDALGIRNIYLGQYERIDGSVVEGPGVSDLVAAASADADAALRARLDATMAAMGEIVSAAEGGEAYDQQIGEGNPAGNARVQAAIDALAAQTERDRRRGRGAQPCRHRLRGLGQPRRPRGGLRVGRHAGCRPDHGQPADHRGPPRYGTHRGAALRWKSPAEQRAPECLASAAILHRQATERRTMCELCDVERAPNRARTSATRCGRSGPICIAPLSAPASAMPTCSRSAARPASCRAKLPLSTRCITISCTAPRSRSRLARLMHKALDGKYRAQPFTPASRRSVRQIWRTSGRTLSPRSTSPGPTGR